MTNAKHTPGPWELRQPDKYPFEIQIVAPDGRDVLFQRRWAYSSEQKSLSDCLDGIGFKYNDREKVKEVLQEQVANARLIAAAPVLLDACQNAFDALESAAAKNPEGNEARVLKLIRTAIYTAIPA